MNHHSPEIGPVTPPSLPDSVRELVRSLQEAGGKPLLVGGWVRDRLLGLNSKDLDIEVFGLTPDRLRKICHQHGRLITVGAAFSVLKLTLAEGSMIDISIPRREMQTGSGHRDFEVHADPFMTLSEAALRRDLTINAISMEPLTGILIDPVGGLNDLHNNLLRHIGPRFSEDALRVLRVYRFQARFGFEIDQGTRDICRRIAKSGALSVLPRERIEEELRKLCLMGRPEMVLKSLRNCREDGIIDALFPELAELAAVPQDARYHAEGDVLEHTFRTVAAASDIAARDGLDAENSWTLCLSALIHDLGKSSTTLVQEDGKIIAHGHDKAGINPAERLLDRITQNVRSREVAIALLKNHMRPLQLATAEKVTDSAIRKLAIAVQPASIEMLCRLVEADTRASVRGDGKNHENAHLFLRSRATALGVDREPMKPLLQGRDLMELARRGLLPERYLTGGKHFSAVLDLAYQKQIDGVFSDLPGAIECLKLLDL